MSNGLLDLFDNFFLPSSGGVPIPGDLFWVPTPECNEVTQILDVQRSDPTEHNAAQFAIVEYNSDRHYRSGTRLPIHRLRLEDTEELLISKSKRRLCVVLCTAQVPSQDVAVLSPAHQRITGHLQKAAYLVAPSFSVATPQSPNAYIPELVSRILKLQYVHLFCLPDRAALQPYEPRSVVRLDLAFPSRLGRGTEAVGFRLADEPWEILLQQFSVLLGGDSSDSLKTVIDILN